MMTPEECVFYDNIVECGIATANEINLVRRCMCGSWTDILNAVFYARTGCRTWNQYIEEEEE